jgi:hypothetical protein
MQLKTGKEVNIVAENLQLGDGLYSVVDLGQTRFVFEGVLSRYVLVHNNQIVKYVDNVEVVNN